MSVWLGMNIKTDHLIINSLQNYTEFLNSCTKC